jgi:hypothetical protein
MGHRTLEKGERGFYEVFTKERAPDLEHQVHVIVIPQRDRLLKCPQPRIDLRQHR